MSKATIIATVALVTIQRSTEVTITDQVFKHEVPILELIHGEDNVTVINDDYHAIELPNNATQEYQRMVTKYGDKYRPVVDTVFRNGPRDVAKELGMDLGKDTYRRQSEAVIESRLPPRPDRKGESSKDSTDAGAGKSDASNDDGKADAKSDAKAKADGKADAKTKASKTLGG